MNNNLIDTGTTIINKAKIVAITFESLSAVFNPIMVDIEIKNNIALSQFIICFILILQR